MPSRVNTRNQLSSNFSLKRQEEVICWGVHAMNLRDYLAENREGMSYRSDRRSSAKSEWLTFSFNWSLICTGKWEKEGKVGRERKSLQIYHSKLCSTSVASRIIFSKQRSTK